MACMYVSFRCYSDEDLSKLGITSSPVGLSPMQAASSPLHAMSHLSSLRDATSGQLNSQLPQDSDKTASLSMASVLDSLNTSRKVLQSQIDEVFELKVCTITSLLMCVIYTVIFKALMRLHVYTNLRDILVGLQ